LASCWVSSVYKRGEQSDPNFAGPHKVHDSRVGGLLRFHFQGAPFVVIREMIGLKPTMHDFGLDNKESTRGCGHSRREQALYARSMGVRCSRVGHKAFRRWSIPESKRLARE
jgi:hypothetical protein